MRIRTITIGKTQRLRLRRIHRTHITRLLLTARPRVIGCEVTSTNGVTVTACGTDTVTVVAIVSVNVTDGVTFTDTVTISVTVNGIYSVTDKVNGAFTTANTNPVTVNDDVTLTIDVWRCRLRESCR